MSTRADIQENGRIRWRTALRECLGENPAAISECTDIGDMLRLLQPLMGSEVNHTYFPTGGGLGMQTVRLGHEHGTIEFKPKGNAAYLCKPKKMSIHYFDQDPVQSFIYITCERLEPTGTYEHNDRGQEEVVETAPQEYHPRTVWDEGHLGYDENGDAVPLPPESRLALRFLRGSFMLVGYGSFWNGNPHTYFGEHDKWGEARVHELIEQWIKETGAD